MKYIGLFDEKEDIVTKEKLEAVEAAIPTKTSQLDNDSGFITSAPVTSVNTKTGAVILSASDVSAIPSTLTGTAGQVLTKTADGQEWKDAQSGGMTATQYTFTLLSGNWITDIGYKIQQVTVTGLKQNYPISPDVDCVLSGADADGDTAILEGWELVQFAETASDKITFKCIGDAPAVNIPVILRVFE